MTDDPKPDCCVALITGGAVLGFDHRVHIDLDRSHTVLSPNDARQFAAEIKRIADVIDPSSREAATRRWRIRWHSPSHSAMLLLKTLIAPRQKSRR
jgi:hypothetical protein